MVGTSEHGNADKETLGTIEILVLLTIALFVKLNTMKNKLKQDSIHKRWVIWQFKMTRTKTMKTIWDHLIAGINQNLGSHLEKSKSKKKDTVEDDNSIS